MNGITIYLAGAMAGREGHGFEAFETATGELRAAGYTVMSPHEGVPEDHRRLAAEMGARWRTTEQYTKYLLRDLAMIAKCDEVYLLRGWERSAGARAEVAFATARGIPVRRPDEWSTSVGTRSDHAEVSRTSIRRFRGGVDCGFFEIIASETGDLVTYEDHEADKALAVIPLEVRIRELEAAEKANHGTQAEHLAHERGPMSWRLDEVRVNTMLAALGEHLVWTGKEVVLSTDLQAITEAAVKALDVTEPGRREPSEEAVEAATQVTVSREEVLAKGLIALAQKIKDTFASTDELPEGSMEAELVNVAYALVERTGVHQAIYAEMGPSEEEQEDIDLIAADDALRAALDVEGGQ